MDIVNLAVEAGTKAEYERNEARIKDWGRHAVIGLVASIFASAIFLSQYSPHWGSVTWMFCVAAYSYLGLMGGLTVWFWVDRFIYRWVLSKSEKPYPHSIFLPKDVAETKAQGKCSCELEAWEKHVVRWANDNLGKSAMRKGNGGYRFYFKEFEDYALFKLWV